MKTIKMTKNRLKQELKMLDKIGESEKVSSILAFLADIRSIFKLAMSLCPRPLREQGLKICCWRENRSGDGKVRLA